VSRWTLRSWHSPRALIEHSAIHQSDRGEHAEQWLSCLVLIKAMPLSPQTSPSRCWTELILFTDSSCYLNVNILKHVKRDNNNKTTDRSRDTWPVESVIDRFLFEAGPQDSVYFRRQPRAALKFCFKTCVAMKFVDDDDDDDDDESPAFFSSAFRSLFSALTRSCSITVFLATRSDHFSFSFTFNFAFNPRDLYTRG